MANRKAIEKYILDLVEAILPGGPNKEMYTKWFAGLSDKQFGLEMEKFGNGQMLRIIAPNGKPYKLDFERNLDLGRSLFNHEFWQSVTLKDDDTGLEYGTPIRFLSLKLYYNRHEQHITDKQSMPDKPRSTDLLTGQAIGPGAAISNPEADILMSQGKPVTLNEFFNARGGDAGMFRQMESELSNTGKTSQASLNRYASGAQSNKTFSIQLKTGHLDNNMPTKGVLNG